MRVGPDGFDVDVLRCSTCSTTTVAHGGLRVPCEICCPVSWVVYGGKLVVVEPKADSRRQRERFDQFYGSSGFAYVGRRVHVKPKKAPPSRVWVRHLKCGRVMPKVTPYPQAPRCPWCEDLPDRSLAALGDLPGHLYLLEWGTGRSRFLKVGIGLADRPRIHSQLREGARVLEVRAASLIECRKAEQRMLRELRDWQMRPPVALRLAGDTECLKPTAPVGRLREWFESGVSSRDVTRSFR